MIDPQEYKELIARESLHWGQASQDAENPQIWHDPVLFEIFFGTEYRRLLDRATHSGPRILELGCGEGGLSIDLATRGMSVTGVDLSDERVARASARAEAAHDTHPPTFKTGDLNTIELPAAAYDCIVAHDSLHHILALERLCAQVDRALKPGGSFLIMDYIGMGRIRKVVAAALFGILPTYQPYRMKWQFRKRMKAFMATEDQKRRALEGSTAAPLHPDSPFEEISQASILAEVRKRFDIVELETYCPFWFYLAAKIWIPVSWKKPMARMLRTLDDLTVKSRLAPGAYVWIAARKRPTTP